MAKSTSNTIAPSREGRNNATSEPTPAGAGPSLADERRRDIARATEACALAAMGEVADLMLYTYGGTADPPDHLESGAIVHLLAELARVRSYALTLGGEGSLVRLSAREIEL